MANLKAEIIAVGSELLTPDRVDTNSLFLTAQLNRLGIEVTRKTVVGDELAALRDAFHGAMERAELVIASGGLGPTEDDRTRDAVADLLGPKTCARSRRHEQNRSALPAAWPHDVRSEHTPGDGAGRRRRPRKRSRNRAGTVAGIARTHRDSASRPAARIESHVQRAGGTAPGAPLDGSAPGGARIAHRRDGRIRRRSAHRADLYALQRMCKRRS